MTAQGAETVPWAENTEKAAPPEPAPQPRRGFLQELKEQFRAAAKAILDVITPAQRRKKQDETKRGLQLARTITEKITRSILHYLYTPTPYDPEQQKREETERFLRRQIDEWTRDEEHGQGEENFFDYRRASGFDPHL